MRPGSGRILRVPKSLKRANQPRSEDRVSPKDVARIAALASELLKDLLLFPEEATPSSREQHRTFVRNTFLDVDPGESEGSSRCSSEPKDFKPGSDSESSLSSMRSERPLTACASEGEASDTQVPVDRKLSAGSCLDRSCTSACVWFNRAGSCREGALCRNCHLCTEAESKAARKKARKLLSKISLRPEATGARGPGLSVGSCSDGTCGEACAWHADQKCTQGSQCRFCHVCSPTKDILDKRARIEQRNATWKRQRNRNRAQAGAKSAGGVAKGAYRQRRSLTLQESEPFQYVPPQRGAAEAASDRAVPRLHGNTVTL